MHRVLVLLCAGGLKASLKQAQDTSHVPMALLPGSAICSCCSRCCCCLGCTVVLFFWGGGYGGGVNQLDAWRPLPLLSPSSSRHPRWTRTGVGLAVGGGHKGGGRDGAEKQYQSLERRDHFVLLRCWFDLWMQKAGAWVEVDRACLSEEKRRGRSVVVARSTHRPIHH